MSNNTPKKYAIIGGGPCGLSAAKNLQDQGIEFEGFDAAEELGGLWNINNPVSAVYESAHLISSKTMTEYKDYPMTKETADYPSQKEVFKYLKDYALKFDLKKHFHLNTFVDKVDRIGKNHWTVSTREGVTRHYKGVLICNGSLSKPNYPDFKGDFDGQIIHSKDYNKADIFNGKRVLIVGAGNSGCDIAVDAVHRAEKVSLSVRRGYHFVPKYAFGKPADTIGGKIKIPTKLKIKIETQIAKWFAGDPVKLGFPKPDHKMFETHPIINSLVLYHLGHGDLDIKSNIEKYDGKTVHFVNGDKEEFDVIVYCTGYKLSYPFIENKLLRWHDSKTPDFYLQIFHPNFNDLFIVGMVESTGLGWEYRNQQARLVSHFLKAYESNSPKAHDFIELKKQGMVDLTGPMEYLDVPRMAFYVHKQTYQKAIDKAIDSLC